MSSGYVQERDGNLYVGKSRVTVATILFDWRAGQMPEEIHEGFPSVPLSDIYGTIAYYLEHQAEMDQYLLDIEELWRTQRAASEAAHPEFYAKMRERFAEARARLGPDAAASSGSADVSAETPIESPTS